MNFLGLHNTQVTEEQVSFLCAALCDPKSKLKSLGKFYRYYCAIQSVYPKAVEYCHSFHLAFGLENNNVCKTPSILEVEGISFEHIPEALFSESLSCLEHVTFHNTFGYSATDAQIEMLISRIVSGKGLSRLRRLSLILVSLCHLDPVLLTSLVTSEVRLTLTDCRVTVSQMREIQKKFQVWEVEHQSNSEVRINVKNFKQ